VGVNSIMEDIIKNIQYFAKLFNNIRSKDETERKKVEIRLLEVINKLSIDELKVFSKYYLDSYYVDLITKFQEGTLKKEDGGAVSILRYNLLQHLLKNEKLTSELIDVEKQKIKDVVNKYNKNYEPFRSWKNDGVLYHFCYYPHKEKIKDELKKFTNKLRTKLNIFNKTEINVVTFDGARNQGFDHCWIAIYDNRFRSQQETKQIYVGFWDDVITFDIYEHKTEKRGNNLDEARGRLSYDDFNFETLVNFFKDKKEDIFELRHLEKDLDNTIKKFKKNKKFTKKEKEIIEERVYSEESIFNSPFQTVKRENHHYKIYNSIKEYLGKNYDNHNFEENNVDITAIKKNQVYLFEIKPFEDSKYTIRAALGQLLEYYYKGKKNANFLCFVGVTPLGNNKLYFDYLKTIFKNENFELKYFHVDYEKKMLVEDI
jgi:hypothetical protein|tara:strand:+ start:134 stop:1420 length:1287 start_codon:yes stop_codon:yes gene_type:complete